MFGSTSKITFSGAGVGFFGASADNIRFTQKQIAAQSISWDKMNMLRHVRFFKDMEGIRHMLDRQAELLRPKFDRVLSILEQELDGCGAGANGSARRRLFYHLSETRAAPSGSISCARKPAFSSRTRRHPPLSPGSRGPLPPHRPSYPL